MKTLLFAVPCAAALGFAGTGCSDEPDGSGGAGGEGGAGGSPASSSSSSSSSGSGGMGGMGGAGGAGGGCGDTMTDPANCGTCDNQCAPGQTCAGGVCTCGSTSVAFAEVQTILSASCAVGGCHSGAAPKQGLDLTSANAHAELVNVPAEQCAGETRMRVKPGAPSESYIIDKMMNVDKCAGNKMPPSIALSDAKIQVVSDWICGGAMP
ncbi:PE-PGRS family protein [Polyangium mundeleinium]|uniref:PE-PGRS family protein n=1 Tax=Polyangium mundeleinium TaxID=2995306 RepID=A0ABT5F645_9BACT|nr:PE-PGRS family protein [Polyangium mundeleinium]MDC0748957.1 PE-PGRS family protein [Polyangium mundeleinium]